IPDDCCGVPLCSELGLYPPPCGEGIGGLRPPFLAAKNADASRPGWGAISGSPYDPHPQSLPHKEEGSTPNTRRCRAHAKLSEKNRPALTGERRAVVSALSIPLSVCQWIGPQLDVHGPRFAAFAAFHQPRRAIAVGAPQPAAFPAGVGIIDAAVEALGIKAHGVGDAQHHHLRVLERDEAVV